jgi:2-oxo-4-hydroxy-4-carboxy-5-ureidoimidazoline decarboxylase
MSYTITELNEMSHEAFVEALGEVFEHTPEIAARTWYQRPFADVSELHQKMKNIVNAMNEQEQLALIRAHPDLGSKTKMAEASAKEQAGVGLDKLNQEEYERFQQLNQNYQNKFAFPFIVAVKNQTKTSILNVFESRLSNSLEIEREQAIQEILQIAWYRLLALVEYQ